MRRLLAPLAAALLLGSVPTVAAAERSAPSNPALDSLVVAECSFARMSLEQGVRDAFLHWMAPDGVIFHPLASNAREVWSARGRVKATLTWSPVFAEISAAGDLGFTTGPWMLQPDDTARAPGFGHYVSVWQRQGDGSWRVAVDIGISHARPARGVGMDEATPGPMHRAYRSDGALPDLMALDLAWSEDARQRGAVAAFARRAARDVRFCRDGLAPVIGAAGATEMMRLVQGTTLWDPDAQKVSLSGDLGCTYGVLLRRPGQGADADSSVYLHVWRREPGGWKVALALESPLPTSARR